MTTQQTKISFSAPTINTFSLFVDGASRGNPGHSGAGIAIKQGYEWVMKKGFYLGPKLTNNEAEYMACIIGLALVKHVAMGPCKVTVFSDSQLLVRQMSGIYRVKTPHLIILKQKAEKESLGLSVTWTHIPREKNTVADAMANEGVDKKTMLTKSLETLLE